MALGWIGGLTHGPICNGDIRVMLDVFEAESKRTGKAIFEILTREAITVALLLYIELEQVRDHIESIGGSDYKLKKVISGGQPLRKNQMETFLDLSEKLSIVYGSSESGPLAIYSAYRDDTLKANNTGGSIGGVKLRIVSDDGKLCQPYETGSIEVKAPGVFRGYFNRLENPDPQTLKAFTSDGWLKMEDYGHLDTDGNLFVYGRTKDVIVHGGDLFYPGWLEKKLMDHPDILEAFVLPISDPVLYHNICACVRLKRDSNLDEMKLREYCTTLFLPCLIDVTPPKPKFFMITKERFPQTATGKPNKQRLRQMAEEMFGSVQRNGL